MEGWCSDIILEIPKEEYHSTAAATAMRQQMISWEKWCKEEVNGCYCVGISGITFTC